MTYTREQIEQMDNYELDEAAAHAMGWVGKLSRNTLYWEDKETSHLREVSQWKPHSYVEPARELQEKAIGHNPISYANHLDRLTCANNFFSCDLSGTKGFNVRSVANMLQATSRQMTIAAILTLQGEYR